MYGQKGDAVVPAVPVTLTGKIVSEDRKCGLQFFLRQLDTGHPERRAPGKKAVLQDRSLRR